MSTLFLVSKGDIDIIVVSFFLARKEVFGVIKMSVFKKMGGNQQENLRVILKFIKEIENLREQETQNIPVKTRSRRKLINYL